MSKNIIFLSTSIFILFICAHCADLRPSSNIIIDEEGISDTKLISPEDGGTLKAESSNGIHYTLEIPEGALWGQEVQTITITPILDIEGLPEDGDYVAGVILEPDGLDLFKPVTLTIEMPSIPNPEDTFGICYHGAEGEFYCPSLCSVDENTSTITFQIMHFSSWAAWTASTCPEIDSPTLTEELTEEIYKNALTCALRTGGGQADEISGILDDWFYDFVYPSLKSAVDLPSLEIGIQRYVSWYVYQNTLAEEYEYINTKSKCELAREEIKRVLDVKLAELDVECNQWSYVCDKKLVYLVFTHWVIIAQQLLTDYEIDLPSLPEVFEFCDWLAEWLVSSINIVSATIKVDETLHLTPTLKDTRNLIIETISSETRMNRAWTSGQVCYEYDTNRILRCDVGGYPGVWEELDSIKWYSSNPSIAEVGEDTGLVTGRKPGEVTITARGGCDVEGKEILTVEGCVGGYWIVNFSGVTCKQDCSSIESVLPFNFSEEADGEFQGILEFPDYPQCPPGTLEGNILEESLMVGSWTIPGITPCGDCDRFASGTFSGQIDCGSDFYLDLTGSWPWYTTVYDNDGKLIDCPTTGYGSFEGTMTAYKSGSTTAYKTLRDFNLKGDTEETINVREKIAPCEIIQ